jgi:hypothetical protein
MRRDFRRERSLAISDHGEQHQSGQPVPTRAQQRADAKAAKARAKALRPWWQKKRYVIPFVLLGLTFVAGALDSGNTDTTATAENAESMTTDPVDDDGGSAERTESTTTDRVGDDNRGSARQVEAAVVGDPVDDGGFRFVVDGVDCGRDRVGGEFFRERAQGQFCLLSVSVENIGDEAGSLFADNQYLIDGRGGRHSADGSATFALDPEGDTWFEEINPGNTVTGEIVFDVPEDRRMLQAELHDSAFSGGVLVDLR